VGLLLKGPVKGARFYPLTTYYLARTKKFVLEQNKICITLKSIIYLSKSQGLKTVSANSINGFILADSGFSAFKCYPFPHRTKHKIVSVT
jgi:hypothetical protein